MSSRSFMWLLGLCAAACAPRAGKDGEPSAVWAVSTDGHVVRTAGASVLRKRISEAALHGVFAVDAHSVWVVGERGAVWHSSDGGESFDPQVSGTAGTLYALSFSSPAHGVIVGERGIILSTEDGGVRWRQVELEAGAPTLRAVALSRSWGLGVAAGDAGMLLLTRDGGRSFVPMSSPTRESIVHVALLDESATIILTTASGASYSITEQAEP